MHEGLRIYNLLPWRAGRVVQWQAHLPRIAAMNFNAVYVNGFHAPGAAGSVLDHYALNPVLRGPILRGPILRGPILRGAEATDDAALLAGFAASCAEHKLMAMMDLAIDHMARTSPLVVRHPGWFARDNAKHGPELAEIAFAGDAAEDEATEYFVGVARHYVELGFRVFRCDAAHRVPARVWRAITDAVRAGDPGVLFCADARGATVPEVLRLARARFDYVLNSAKYWDFTSSWLLDQYEQFRGLAPSIAFPEFHDTPRLAADLARAGITDPDVVRAHYRRAYGFAASVSTAVLMPMGYEYGWARPPDDTTTREPARFDLSPFIGAMNAAKRDTPALNQEGPQRLLSTDEEEATVLVRRTADGADWAYIVLNRDADAGTIVSTDWLLGAAPGPIRLEDVTPEYFDDRIRVNLKHQFFAIQAVVPDMKKAGAGSIVNMTSTSWMVGSRNIPVYVTAKAGAYGLVRGLARDLGRHNIRINAFAPGWVMTERQKTLWATPEALARLMEDQSLQRTLEPADMARAILFLASDEASAATNQNFVFDAGWL